MDKIEAQKILNFVSDFEVKAEAVKRYEGNPYVEGDNIPEHVARAARLLICMTPALKKEFPEQPELVEWAMTCLIVHDDDEVIEGFDIPTALKSHNAKDSDEIAKFETCVADLEEGVRLHLNSAFGSFRRKDSLAAKIAKVLDNLTGNQLVIEQKTGLINPDLARFSIEYAEKVRGVSQTTDAFVDAQIEQIIAYRESLKSELDKLNLGELEEKARTLLQADVLAHVLDKSKVYAPLREL